ncbi:MAG: hypothetical protein WCT08_06025 [Patescibacteria group bacterium]|jgi:hypothetical protein
MRENPSEQEQVYSSPEEKFANEIESRYTTWISIVDESDVDEKTKGGIKKDWKFLKKAG